MLEHGPWAFDGAILALEPWRPNTVLENFGIRRVLLWVQIRGLPLKFQFSEFAERLAQVIGNAIMMDWKNITPRNLRFMGVRVWVNPEFPLITGCMLRRDDGVMMWVRFRYERVGKMCKRCRVIGHTNPHRPFQTMRLREHLAIRWTMFDIVLGMIQVVICKTSFSQMRCELTIVGEEEEPPEFA
ncbi:hypothetical protein PTKIN_Ptkin05aG0116100 [Pterospermum kingtungense]